MTGLRNQQGVAPEVDYQGEPNVTPEEQAEYDKFVDNGSKLIFDENMAPQILKRIEEAEAPAEGLASVVVNLVLRLRDAARQSGAEIDPAILMHGGMELMENLAELSAAAGVHEFSEKEKESALYLAMDKFGTIELETGNLNKEALTEDMNMLQQADQSGGLDQLLGQGFTAHADGLGDAG
ncbi:MAG: hypothetical protein GY832_05125 [Chloroflexi bacterium]|nr:hypothetical protein [Chloroflexota bacterium]